MTILCKSPRSLYILVADNRKEDTDFQYWLNVIELLSDNSPVLILNNKRAGRERKIDQRALKSRFSNLAEVLVSNLATDQELREIYRAIKYQLAGLPHIGTPLPKSWVRVRRALETSPEPHITTRAFAAICHAQGYTAHSEDLLAVLHHLGICLHFKDDILLKKTVILNPTWGTDAVYRVLDNAQVIAQNGRFNNADLHRIWHEPDYTDMQAELLRLMINFELCYEISGQAGHYIAPQLLAVEQADYAWDEADNLILRYTYDFMPKGIISRFIVAIHDYIAEPQADAPSGLWRSGVILTKNSTWAEVIEHYTQSPKITVRVVGQDRRGLLETIMDSLDKIHASFKRLRVHKWVPCNCSECTGSPNPHSYTFENLRKRLIKGRPQVECDISYEQVSVRRLIDDIGVQVETLEHPADRREIYINIDQGNRVSVGNIGGNLSGNLAGGDVRRS